MLFLVVLDGVSEDAGMQRLVPPEGLVEQVTLRLQLLEVLQTRV